MTFSAVLLTERAIRSAINAAWSQAGEKNWKQLFRPGPDGTISRPSNGQLIVAGSDGRGTAYGILDAVAHGRSVAMEMVG